MKKKFVVALVAAMSLTVAGTGTVFAMDKVSTVASEKEHVHGDNCEWIVDKPAWTETVEHPEEGHYETVVVKPAWDEEVHRIGTFCHNCGFEIHSIDEWIAHSKASNGQCMSYGDKEVTEIIHHEAVVEQQWRVDKPAWTETIEHPEEGHWVCNGEPQKPEQKPENPDQKPEQPENPDQKPEQPENPDQKPEQPENPDQKPEQPENPDVETPETPDVENPETPEQKPEAPTTPEENKENVQTQEAGTKKEGTSPKTGDTASALPVAGAGLASLGVALATILRKRK